VVIETQWVLLRLLGDTQCLCVSWWLVLQCVFRDVLKLSLLVSSCKFYLSGGACDQALPLNVNNCTFATEPCSTNGLIGLCVPR